MERSEDPSQRVASARKSLMGGAGGGQQQLHVSDPQNAAKEQNIEVGRCGSLLAFRLVLSAAALPLHLELSRNRNIVTKKMAMETRKFRQNSKISLKSFYAVMWGFFPRRIVSDAYRKNVTETLFFRILSISGRDVRGHMTC